MVLINAIFLPDGEGLKKPLVKTDSVLRTDSPWSLYGWVKSAETLKNPSLVAGFGDPEEEFSRYLALDSEHVMLRMGKDNILSAPAELAPGRWHLLAATFKWQRGCQRKPGPGKRDSGPRDGPSFFALRRLAPLRWMAKNVNDPLVISIQTRIDLQVGGFSPRVYDSGDPGLISVAFPS